MSELTDKAKKHGINFTVILGIISVVVLLVGQQRILQGMGVVYEETLHRVISEQKEVDKVQNVQIEQVQEGIHGHASMPGHGVGIEASGNLERRVDRLETQADEVSRANQELSIAAARLTEQVSQLNDRMDRLPPQ